MVTILRLTIGVALLTATHLGMAQAWSSSPYADRSYYAWGVYFNNGYDGYNFKYSSGYVRAVRSE